MPVEVIVDRILQLGHAREGAAPDALRRNLCEEAFDEIEPGRTRRREVQLEARMLGQPRLHLGGLVRPIVIEHEMHREVSKHGSIDPLQKANELFRPMPRLAFADDESALHVKGCEKRGGPMTLVVVRHRCGPTALQRQARLRAVKGLDLACMGCSMSRHFGPVSLFDQRTVPRPDRRHHHAAARRCCQGWPLGGYPKGSALIASSTARAQGGKPTRTSLGLPPGFAPISAISAREI